jgi:hypothetical protein
VRRGALGHEPTEAAAVTRHERVEPVEQRGGMERSEQSRQRPGQPNFGEERDAASRVARNRRSVAEDEPPALAALVLGNACE